jgi:hypothetical protein
MQAKQPKSVLGDINLYDVYAVTIVLKGRLCGGIPKNKDLIGDWIRAKTGFDDEKTAEQIENMEEHVEQKAEKSWNGFYQDERGLCIECRCIKAMLKECATVLKITEKKRGSKQLFQHAMLVKPIDSDDDVIPLGLKEPTGMMENVVHAIGPKGPQTALKRVDYVEGVTISFRIFVLKTAAAETRHIGEEQIRQILCLAQDDGLGADRSQGKGTFIVTRLASLQAA